MQNNLELLINIRRKVVSEELSEKDVLEFVKTLKDGVQTLKIKNTDLKTHYKELKEYCDGIQLQLDEANKKNIDLENTVAELRTQLEGAQKQGQQNLENEKAAKDAFLQELTKAIEDANEALKD